MIAERRKCVIVDECQSHSFLPGGAVTGRRLRRLLRSALTLVAALIVVGSFASAAGAQEGPIQNPPPGSFVESWALAPTGLDPSQPSSRPNFTPSLAPGATQQDSVSLWNYSDVPLTFHVYATDAYNNATGDFTLLPANIKARDAGSWITLATDQVTVGAKTRVDIPFTLHVPPTANPGDHTAGIVASLPTPTNDAANHRVIIDRRTGSRVYLRVNGPVNPSLVVEHLSSDYHGSFNPLGGTLDVTYTLRNPGNVRLGARQLVSAHDIFGRTIADHKPRVIPELLPGNAVTVHEKFNDVPATFRVGADVTITPLVPPGSSEKPPATVTAGTGSWAIPWTVLLLLALALLLWRLYRRYRSSHRTAPPLGPGGSPRGGLPPGAPPNGGVSRSPEHVLRFDGRMPGSAAPP
jgi:Bacterial protein of unknown function (DUF916)